MTTKEKPSRSMVGFFSEGEVANDTMGLSSSGGKGQELGLDQSHFFLQDQGKHSEKGRKRNNR